MYWDHVRRGGGTSSDYYWDDFVYADSVTPLALKQNDSVLLFNMQPVVRGNVLCNYVFFTAGEAGAYAVTPDTYYLVIPAGSSFSPVLYFKDEDGNNLTVLEDRYEGGSANSGSSLLLSLFPADAVVQNEDPYADLV